MNYVSLFIFGLSLSLRKKGPEGPGGEGYERKKTDRPDISFSHRSRARARVRVQARVRVRVRQFGPEAHPRVARAAISAVDAAQPAACWQRRRLERHLRT